AARSIARSQGSVVPGDRGRANFTRRCDRDSPGRCDHSECRRSALSKGEMSKERPQVGIIMGSDTDLPTMSESAKMLTKFSIPFEIEVISAHRSPARTHEYATTAIGRGVNAVIVEGGGGQHPGVGGGA